jgi:hypothetical protein
MALDEKPSRNEDEYFAREDADMLKKRRAEIQQQQEKEERARHYMKCPKCGASLREVEMQGVKVDVCSECSGVWFDAGEIDQWAPEDRNPVQKIFGDFFAGLRNK